MSEPTLYNALKDIADAIRDKGITGTMNAWEMPDKIASIVTGGGDKYDITLDGLIGDVNGQGVLQDPSETFTFTSSDIVEIPDDMLDSFFAVKDNITAVSLPNLTTVGEYGMKEICRDCEYLTSANLASLTSIDEHGMEKAFQNCLSLATLNLSGLTTVGNYGLSYAFASTDLSGDLDFSTITSIGNHGLEGLLQNCDSITGVDLSGLTTIPAYGLAYAFDDCGSLVAADLSNVTTVGEGGMKSAFIESSIESLSMPSLTTVGDNGLETAFFNCDSLTTLDLSGVTSIGANGIRQMCTGCALLETVDMSSVETLNGLDYLEAFDQCPSLTTVDISSIQTINFLDADKVPTLTSTVLFDNANNNYEIAVPTELYEEWKEAPYWSDPSIVTHIISAARYRALTFVASQAGSTVKMAFATDTHISGEENWWEYSVDNGETWSNFIPQDDSQSIAGTTVTLNEIGDAVLIRAREGVSTGTLNSIYGHQLHQTTIQFKLTGGLQLRGSLYALLKQDWDTNQRSLSSDTFYRLFMDVKASLDISGLYPLDWSMAGAEYCYGFLFANSNIFGKVPRKLLPVTTLVPGCYTEFFMNCNNLVQAPDLPATTLASSCYYSMFNGCSSLASAPDLPATTLAY